MKLIAHRGLVDGPDSLKENNPSQIELAISMGFDVEIDVWAINNKLYLGHDGPTYETSLESLSRPQVWAHAKNLEALYYLLNNDIHCFWHENDERTLTSNGFIWTYPGKETCPKSIIVILEPCLIVPNNVYGVCGDYVSQWR